MAKRRSLNRRSSKFGRSSSRSSIGSNILDPDSNLFDNEQPFWWNVSLLKSSTHIPEVNEASTVLNPNSQLDNTEEDEWWKHLQTSTSSYPNTSNGITKSPANINTGEVTLIENTSSSASEESISKVQKQKVLLRKTTQRREESNAFLEALNDFAGAFRSQSLPLRDSQDFAKNSVRSEEKIDEESDVSHEIHLDHTYHRILKKKPKFLRKKRQSRSINPFEEILSQQNTSPRSSPGRSLEHTTADQLGNQENSTTFEKNDNLKGDTRSNKYSKNVSNAEAIVESTDESDTHVEFVKPKSRFLTRTRRSSTKNVFENILADEENSDSAEKKNSTHKDDSVSKPVRTSANENASNVQSISNPNEKGDNILETNNSELQHADSSVEDTRARKTLNNTSLNARLIKNHSENANVDKVDRNRVSRSEDRSVVSRYKENEGCLSKSITNYVLVDIENEIANERSMSDSVNEEKRSSRSQRHKRVAKSLNRNSSLLENVNKSPPTSNKDTTVGNKTSNDSQVEENHSGVSKNDSKQSKNTNIGTSEKKENSGDFQLQLSTSSDSDIIQRLAINQSLAQKTLESDITLNTFKNLNVAASSTPIDSSRRSKRLSNVVHPSVPKVAQESSRNKTPVKSVNIETNVLSLENIDEEDEVDVAETPQNVIKRKQSSRVSEKPTKRQKTVDDVKNKEDELSDEFVDVETVDLTENAEKSHEKSSRSRVPLHEEKEEKFSEKDPSIGRNRSRLRTPDKQRKSDVEENASTFTSRSLRRRPQSRMVFDKEEEKVEESIPSPSLRRKSRLQKGIGEDSLPSSPLHQSISRRTRSQRILDDEEELEELEERAPSPIIGRRTKSRTTLGEEDERVERNISLPINISPSRRTRSQLLLDEEEEINPEENAASPVNTLTHKNKSGLKSTPEKKKRNDAEESSSSPANKLSTRQTRSQVTLDDGDNIQKNVSSVVSSNDVQNPKRRPASDRENIEKNLNVSANTKGRFRKVVSTRTVPEDDEEAEEDEGEERQNLSGPQERRSPRNKSTLAVPKSRNDKDSEVADKRRTDSRTSHTALQRSSFFRKDTSTSNPATSMSRGQRTLGDFFKSRSPSKSLLQHSTVASQAFADKQKVEEVRKKLEELKKRKLPELEANLNRQKKQAVDDVLKPKVATKKPMREKNTAQVDKAYIVNGHVYKRPKLTRPKHWVTDRLYKFLWKRMEPKYALATRARSEKFVLGLCEVVSIVCRRKMYDNYKEELNALITEMARIGIIRTRKDFYDFCFEFLPAEFREKAVPMMKPGNVRNIPFDPSTVFQPLLNRQE